MKFGTFLFQTQPAGLAAVARKAEELGFESLWIPEHIVLPVKYSITISVRLERQDAGAAGDAASRSDAGARVRGGNHHQDSARDRSFRAADTQPVYDCEGGRQSRRALGRSLYLRHRNRMARGGVRRGWNELPGSRVALARVRRVDEGTVDKEDPVYAGKTVRVEGVRFMPKPVQKPHPPLVFGGHTEPSLKRAARLGDGWYGIAESLDETRRVIARLREHERAFERTRPLELTVSPRLGGPLTVDQVKQLGEMGVTRILYGGGPAREQIAAMEKFRDDVMSATS